MINDIKDSPLYSILNPRSVVFFGASNSYTSMGTSQLNSLKSLDFKGSIYPVHPKETEVQGFMAYKSVLDLPEVPDLAIVVLPTHIVPDVIRQCGEKGIRHAIVVSGGFKEIGSDGADLESRLIEVARRYNIRFIGPNCIGVANPHSNLNTTFFRYDAPAGFIGMASQSGSFITQMFNYLSRFSLGFSNGISVGNEADLDLIDSMEYLAVCPNTKVIALYIEAIRRGRAFVELARAITPHKPIVAFYVGGSDAGKRASLSHTGAMAGPDNLYDGIFRQSGVIRADSIEQLFDFSWVLGSCQGPKGNRIIIQTHSGGPGTAAADACGKAGLVLPSLTDKTRQKLGPYVPKTGSLSNPVDLTFTKNPLDYFSNVPRILLEEDVSDGLLIYFLVFTETVVRALENMGVPKEKARDQAKAMIEDQSNSVANLVDEYQKPVIGFSFRSREDLLLRQLQERGVPVLSSPERAAFAMEALVRYFRYKERLT